MTDCAGHFGYIQLQLPVFRPYHSMYVCMCVYVSMHESMYAFMYVCIYVCINNRRSLYVWMYDATIGPFNIMFFCMYVCMCMCELTFSIWLYVWMNECMFVCMYVTGLFPARGDDTAVYLQAVLASASVRRRQKIFLEEASRAANRCVG